MEEISNDLGLIHFMDTWEVGCGISFQDFNNDGWDDITLGSERGRPISLYVNDNGTLNRIPSIVNNVENVRQILWIDYDNDGDKDLYVSAYDGISRLYRQESDFKFRDITSESNLPTSNQRAIGATWGDVNRDGWLDLYYSIRKNASYGVTENQNRLFLNLGGSFEEVSSLYQVEDKNRAPFCASFIDVNNDLWPDIYIANDRAKRNTFYLNQQGKSYIDISEESNAGIYMDAMCVTPADINNDELTDIYIANTGTEGNKLLINNTEDPEAVLFSEEATAYNLTYNHTAWSSVFYDSDNDGDLDLFVSGTQFVTSDFSSLFYENESADFKPVHYNNLLGKASFASAKGDLNNDGLIDMLIQINPPDPYQFWVNTSDRVNNFIKLKLEGVISNREGIGCHIRVYTDGAVQYQQKYSNTGYLGQDSDVLHFGIGLRSDVDSIKVIWPTGHIDWYFDMLANETYTLREGASSESIQVDDDVSIFNNLTVATNNSYSHAAISLFPNPTSDKIILDSPERINMLELLSISGNSIKKKTSFTQSPPQLNVSDLTPGLYIIKITIDRRVYTEKFVKL